MSDTNLAKLFCDLSGKTALVTGGSRGIGQAIGQRFLEAGATVILVARREDVLQATADGFERLRAGRTFTYACDLGNGAAITELCEALERKGHAIDILVNNGGSSVRMPFETMTEAVWRQDFDVKLIAAFRLAQFVLKGMKSRRWGRIINVVSSSAKAPRPNSAPTTVSRAAGIAMTKVMAGEFAPYNILVNALCAGMILTDQIHERHSDLRPSEPLQAQIDEEARQVPLGRMGSTEEFANMALFLASDAGSFVTGAAINVDGGTSPVV